MSFTPAYPPVVTTSPGLPHPHWRATKSTRIISRTAFLLVAITLVVTSAPSVAGFEPDQSETNPVSTQDVTAADTTRLEEPTTDIAKLQQIRTELVPTTGGCNPLFADFCVELATAEQELPVDTDALTACALPGDHSPTGSLVTVPAPPIGLSADNAMRLQIEVEEGLAIDRECFAATAISILTDERGWTSVEGVSFTQVDDNSYDFKLVLASPTTTDSLCYPANTVGRYSCRNHDKVVINLVRWETGTDDYADNLTTYRHYLLNHEVGHFLGKGHLSCPAAGEPAPVMMQQTKGIGECLPNGWPTEDER